MFIFLESFFLVVCVFVTHRSADHPFLVHDKLLSQHPAGDLPHQLFELKPKIIREVDSCLK